MGPVAKLVNIIPIGIGSFYGTEYINLKVFNNPVLIIVRLNNSAHRFTIPIASYVPQLVALGIVFIP